MAINTALIVMDMLQVPTTVLHGAQRFSQIDNFCHNQMATVAKSLPYPAQDRAVYRWLLGEHSKENIIIARNFDEGPAFGGPILQKMR